MNDSKLYSFFWLWLPLLVIPAQFLFEFLVPSDQLPILMSEAGPHEIAQVAILFLALLIAFATLFKLNWKTQKWLGAWIALAGLCCFYVVGEEISWGQHILKWNTPEYWAAINDQNETNFHNTSSWLDQKPRLILLIGIITGGLLIPLAQRFKPGLLPARFTAIYPPAQSMLIALLVIATQLVDLLPVKIFERPSEVQELYMFYFVLLYLAVLRRRILQR
jgi:hypothetical protein